MNRQKFELFDERNRDQILPFVLIACCFALWGFTMDMTSAMVSTFSKIFRMSLTEGTMLNLANHMSYFVIAIPAALFIQKYRYKAGVLIGLFIYAVGAMLFFPSKFMGTLPPFLFSFFVMTCGSAFLETCCHPMVYTMGGEESGIGRLTLAQACNALGALIGMFVVRDIVQVGMSPLSKAERLALPEAQSNMVRLHDLNVLTQPYIFISAVIVLMIVVIWLMRFKSANDTASSQNLVQEFLAIAKERNYREGFVTQFFYVGGQVCCWAYIIQYGLRIFCAEGMTETSAEIVAQKYNIAAIVMFALFRFIFTWLLKYVDAGRLLSVMAIIAMTLTLGTILFPDRNGLYCLILISGCMSLMFATIYGIALRGMGNNVKMAAAGMTMAVFGGAVFPPLQAAIIDSGVTLLGLSSTNISFVVPLLCFAVVALYGHRSYIRFTVSRNFYG